jgi:hypothetical protein
VDGVVAAQAVVCGEVAGVAGQWLVDRDDADLGVEILERGDRAGVELGPSKIMAYPLSRVHRWCSSRKAWFRSCHRFAEARRRVIPSEPWTWPGPPHRRCRDSRGAEPFCVMIEGSDMVKSSIGTSRPWATSAGPPRSRARRTAAAARLAPEDAPPAEIPRPSRSSSSAWAAIQLRAAYQSST